MKLASLSQSWALLHSAQTAPDYDIQRLGYVLVSFPPPMRLIGIIACLVFPDMLSKDALHYAPPVLPLEVLIT